MRQRKRAEGVELFCGEWRRGREIEEVHDSLLSKEQRGACLNTRHRELAGEHPRKMECCSAMSQVRQCWNQVCESTSQLSDLFPLVLSCTGPEEGET